MAPYDCNKNLILPDGIGSGSIFASIKHSPIFVISWAGQELTRMRELRPSVVRRRLGAGLSLGLRSLPLGRLPPRASARTLSVSKAQFISAATVSTPAFLLAALFVSSVYLNSLLL